MKRIGSWIWLFAVVAMLFFTLRYYQDIDSPTNDQSLHKTKSTQLSSTQNEEKTIPNEISNEVEKQNPLVSERKLKLSEKTQVLILPPRELILYPKTLGEKWKLVPNLRGFPLSELQNTNNLFLKLSGYGLIESTHTSSLSGGSVVYDSRLQQYGVVTGTIIVKLQEGSNNFLNSNEWLIVDSLPRIKTVLVQPKGMDLVVAVNKLKENPMVEDVQVEILSRRWGKN